MTLDVVYVCYICRSFFENEIVGVVDNEEKAKKWSEDNMKKIDQIEGLRHAAETRYKDDAAKYKDVLRQADAFESKTGLPKGTWLATYKRFEMNAFEQPIKYDIR